MEVLRLEAERADHCTHDFAGLAAIEGETFGLLMDVYLGLSVTGVQSVTESKLTVAPDLKEEMEW